MYGLRRISVENVIGSNSTRMCVVLENYFSSLYCGNVSENRFQNERITTYIFVEVNVFDSCVRQRIYWFVFVSMTSHFIRTLHMTLPSTRTEGQIVHEIKYFSSILDSQRHYLALQRSGVRNLARAWLFVSTVVKKTEVETEGNRHTGPCNSVVWYWSRLRRKYIIVV